VFLDNPDQLEHVLQIVDRVETSALPTKKPKSEFELLWSDYKLIWHVEK